MAKAPTFIDLFAGGGGLSLGLCNAGWKGLFAIEKDPWAFQTIRFNFLAGREPYRFAWPDWLPLNALDIKDVIRKYHRQLRSLQGKVDLLAGGPPCQGFSTVGRRNHLDPRNTLFESFIEFAKLIKPKLVLIENVLGITAPFNGNESSFAERICDVLSAGGYQVDAGILRAVDFGVPQLRPRFIFIGSSKTRLQWRPIACIQERRRRFLKSKGLPTNRFVSVKDALSDLTTADSRFIECLDFPGFKQAMYNGPRTAFQTLMHGHLDGMSPNSMRLVQHRTKTAQRFGRIRRLRKNGGPLTRDERKRLGLKKNITIVLNANRPSHTLTTLPDDILHYSESRILSVREYARLQSFPDWYQFHGNYTVGGRNRVLLSPRYSQVGNAVPPLLAEAVGQHLKSLL